MKWLLALLPFSLLGQTVTLTPIGNQDVSGIPVTVEHLITTGNGSTSVRIFRTHFGNGNTSQYANWPMSRSEMNKCFNTAWSATTLWWSGNMNATSSLSFYNFQTLTSAGAAVPPNGDYYATEITFTFVPLETGTYSFGLTSDDGGDLTIAGTSVIEFYGGKGTGPFKYGTYYMVAGQQYTAVTRMQEYGGGDGLGLMWRRPSQSSWSLQTNEIGIASSNWVNQGTQLTNSGGVVNWSNPSSRPYRVTVDVSSKYHTILDQDLLYIAYMKTFPQQMESWDFYTCDCDNSSVLNWDDIIFCDIILKNGYLHNKYIFTTQEKNEIEADYRNSYYNKYFPKQVRTIENENQFYIMGTGKHRTTTLMQKIQ